MPRPLIIQTEDLAPAAAAFLAERCELVVCPPDGTRFMEMLKDAQALVVRTYTRVDERLLSHAPRLRVVGRAGVGLDSIDVRACRERGVRVVYTPDANSQAVAEYVFAMLFDVLRPRVVIDRALPLADWNTLRREMLAPRQLGDLTMGVLGLGRIGTRVARIGGAFGMRVLYHDVQEIAPADRAGATPVSLEQLLAQSDVLTLHVDNRPENRHLLNEGTLASVKKDATIVNAARGFVVDPHALARMLSRNQLATALLDVHDPEPIRDDSPLLGLANARLSPHIAAATMAAHEAMSWVVRDVWRVLEGEKPHFQAW